MNTHEISAPVAALLRKVGGGRVVRLGNSGGRLDVIAGRVWLTREGDLEDRVVEGGQTLGIAESGDALVEALDRDGAVIRWTPRSIGERLRDGTRTTLDRCWHLVSPTRRAGIGSVAAVMALAIGAAVFGPLSDARSHKLAAAHVKPRGATHLAPHAVLHNADGSELVATRAARPVDAAVLANDRPGPRPGDAAQEARRRAPGAA